MKKNHFLLALGLIIFAAVSGSFLVANMSYSSTETLNSPEIPKAAIIDQLYSDIPNEYFHKEATTYLEGAGYHVDIFTTKDITIDFYKNLPSLNYNFVIIRTHGAVDTNEQNAPTLFTGERYQEDMYITEQLFGHAKRVTPLYDVTFDTTSDDSEWQIVNDTYRIRSSPVKIDSSSSKEYFAITSKLIDDAMIGKFSGTTFVLGGCDTMKSTSLAESLVRRGALNVVGWDEQILASENDMMILALLDKLFVSKTNLNDSVNSLMKDFSQNWTSNPARMQYYA